MFEAQEAWIKTFGHAPGWGHWLTWEFPERWTRLHALPLSKQYPDTPEEMTTIVERANTLAEECMGGSTCVSLIMLDEECNRNLCNANQSLDWQTLLTWTDESDPPEERFESTFLVARITWVPHVFDWLFAGIAEEAMSALFFSHDHGTVFAPYDGGFDILCSDAEKLRHLERKYESWMPDRADKL